MEVVLGFAYNEFWGQVHFYVTFIGVNITFFPMHLLGLAGMPRRIPDYPDEFETYNAIETFGSGITVISVLIFIFNFYWLLFRNKRIAAKQRGTMLKHSGKIPPFRT
jgi:cytochrome c oxidase subunit 1